MVSGGGATRVQEAHRGIHRGRRRSRRRRHLEVHPLVADVGHPARRLGAAAPGRRPDRDPRRDRHAGHHHRRAARGRVAVAPPDGLRAGRLVQLRQAGHEGDLGGPHPARAPGARRGRHRPDRPGGRLRGQGARPRPHAGPVRGHRAGDGTGDGDAGRDCRDDARRPRRVRQVPRDRRAAGLRGVLDVPPPPRTGRRHAAHRADAAPRRRGHRRDEGPRAGHGLRNLRDDAAPDGRHPRARGAQPGAARDRPRGLLPADAPGEAPAPA